LRSHADLLRGEVGAELSTDTRALLATRAPALAPLVVDLLDVDPTVRATAAARAV
jgi:hypothetical protein